MRIHITLKFEHHGVRDYYSVHIFIYNNVMKLIVFNV